MIDYMTSDQYRDWNSIKGTWSYSGADLSILDVDFIIPQENDAISVLNYKKDITIDHTMVDADLTDFPLLIDIYDTDLKTKVQNDGDDIIFKSGEKTLPHEIDLFEQDHNSTHAHLVAWVRTDLASSVDTTITMHYGNPNLSIQQNPSGVWNQDYMGVWHLGEVSGGSRAIKDSTSNNNHGTDAGSPTFGINGTIGKAITFDGLDDLINCDNGPSLRIAGDVMTIEAWVYLNEDTPPQWGTGIVEKDGSYSLMQDWDGSRKFTFSVTASSQTWTSHSNNDLYRWYHVVGVYDGTNTYLYVDGIQRNFNANTGPIVETINPLYIGRGDQYFDGRIDEVRVLNTNKTVEWILAEFRNQNDPASFMGVGAEQNTQYGSSVTLQLTTDASAVVDILPRMYFNVTVQESTYDANMMTGTSFFVANGTGTTWIANVLVSTPPGLNDLRLSLTKPTTWTLTEVTDVVDQNRLSEVTATSTEVMVSSSTLDVEGVWTFTFSSNNEASLLECGANAGAYGNTVTLQTGNLAKFRGTATLIPGSAMRLYLIDPSGQVYYSSDDLSQDGSGQFEWTGISVTSAWPNGLWEVLVDFNNTAGSGPERVGRYSRLFTIEHVSSLSLISPADAIGDGISVRTAGDLLEVEVQLTDTETAQNVAGSTVTMNWSVLSVETQVQFEDYGNGVYGKTLNTSDLGQPGNWRLNIVSSHPYLINSTTYFDLELSHNTILTYGTPPSTPYGDDFTVRVHLQDATTGTLYDGASFTSNGTITGVTDYNNGTYLINIDSTGLSMGTYSYTINAIPAQPFVIESSVEFVFVYREIKTDLVQVETNPVSTPWGQNATVTLNWLDIDHADIGIIGGLVSGDGTFQYTDLLDGRYSIQIDVESFSVGVYMFNFTITRTNYQSSEITVAVSVKPHRTLVVASYDGSIPMGSNVTVTLELFDLDAGNAVIIGNLSSILVEWPGGSDAYGALQFVIESEGWVIGTYTIDITVFTTTSPRHFYDGTTAMLLNVQKLSTALSWDDIDVFPIGDDFEITTYVTVNATGSVYDNTPVNGLLQSHFILRDKDGSVYTIKTFSAQGAGTYVLTLDQSYFLGGSYGIRVFLVFGVVENYSNTQTPIISFQYTQAQSDLSSPDFPLLTISYSTDAIVTLEFVDIDRGQGIDTATFTVTGATELGEQLISSGRYRVTIDTSTWSIGIYTVNFTASAPTYEDKTISIDIQIRQIRTYATATVGALEIPVGDSQTFYADYIDMDHDIPILTISHLCNWTPVHYSIVWTGNRYSITINTFESDDLTSYLLVFDFSAGAEYETAIFNITVLIRTIKTELRLVSPVEDTTPSDLIEISVYYGDRDHLQGIVSSDVLCTVWNTTHQLAISWNNDTSAGYYIITIDASQFGGLGVQQLTVFFNWTGSIQKYENRDLSFSVEIIGEDTELKCYSRNGDYE
jgi:hypothetical protein